MTDYFALFGIPVKFNIDLEQLRNRYFEESKKFHPDYFINESDEAKEEALSQSTLINNAYRTLSQPNMRVKYILELKGILSDKEKEILPQDFLMEMMDINEALMEQDPARINEIEIQVQRIEKEIVDNLQKYCNAFDAIEEINTLQKVKETFLKQKYLLRIKDSMHK